MRIPRLRLPRWHPAHTEVRATQPWVVVILLVFAALLAVAGIGIVTNSADGPSPTPVVVPASPGTVTVIVTAVPAVPGGSGAPGAPGSQGPPGPPAPTPRQPAASRSPSTSPPRSPSTSPTRPPTPSPSCTLHDPRDGDCLL